MLKASYIIVIAGMTIRCNFKVVLRPVYGSELRKDHKGKLGTVWSGCAMLFVAQVQSPPLARLRSWYRP